MYKVSLGLLAMSVGLLLGAGCSRPSLPWVVPDRFQGLRASDVEKVVVVNPGFNTRVDLRPGIGKKMGNQLEITDRGAVASLLDSSLYTDPPAPGASNGYDYFLVTAIPRRNANKRADVSITVHKGTSPRFFKVLNGLTTQQSTKF